MGYLPDGGIKYKSRNGSEFLFGTPEVRLLSVSLFTQTTGQLWVRITLHTKINSSLNLDNCVVIERYQGIVGH